MFFVLLLEELGEANLSMNHTPSALTHSLSTWRPHRIGAAVLSGVYLLLAAHCLNLRAGERSCSCHQLFLLVAMEEDCIFPKTMPLKIHQAQGSQGDIVLLHLPPKRSSRHLSVTLGHSENKYELGEYEGALSPPLM